MRQHRLNGWLVVALVALVCLLGITAYIELRNDLPRAACIRGNGWAQAPVAHCRGCVPTSCTSHMETT